MSTAFEVISGGNYPANPVEGQCVYNQDTNSPEWFNGNVWQDGAGFISAAECSAEYYTVWRDRVKAETGEDYILVSPTDMREFIIHPINDTHVAVVTPGNKYTSSAYNYGGFCIARVNPDKSLTYLITQGTDQLDYNINYFGDKSAFHFSSTGKNIIVGCRGDKPDGSTNTGSALIYDYDDNWTLQHTQRITNFAGISSKNFGHSVAMSADGLNIAIACYGVTTTTTNDGYIEWHTRSSVTEDFTYVGNVIEYLDADVKSNMYFGYLYNRSFEFVGDKLFMGPRINDSLTTTYGGLRKVENNGDGTFTVTKLPIPTGAEAKAAFDGVYTPYSISDNPGYFEYYGYLIIHDRENEELWVAVMSEYFFDAETNNHRDKQLFLNYDVSGDNFSLNTSKCLSTVTGMDPTSNRGVSRAEHSIYNDQLLIRDYKIVKGGTVYCRILSGQHINDKPYYVDFYSNSYYYSASLAAGFFHGDGDVSSLITWGCQ